MAISSLEIDTIYERAVFNQRRQGPDESVEAFVTALHCLAEHCEYQALRDEMIRDRIVVGLKDSKLSEKLQMDPDLTLKKAVLLSRQSELVKKQQETIRNAPGGQTTVDVVEAKKKPRDYKRVSHKPQDRMVAANGAEIISTAGTSALPKMRHATSVERRDILRNAASPREYHTKSKHRITAVTRMTKRSRRSSSEKFPTQKRKRGELTLVSTSR